MKLGLGTVQLGLDYGIANRTGKPGRSEAMTILNAAVSGGIDCLDTAADYGDSEQIIGDFIRRGNIPKLCTKFSSHASAEGELYASLARLGVDKLDYFLLHKPEQIFSSKFGETLDGLNKNPAAVKTGVSVYTPAEVEECLKYDIKVIQIPFNVLDTRLVKSGLPERIKARNIEIHARSIYLQGLLIGAQKKPPGAEKYLKILDDIAKEHSITTKELCFLYVRDCAYIDRFFVGCETAAQVEENLAMNNLPGLSEKLMDVISQAFADVPDNILNPALWNRKERMP
ncbi:MAG: aldo/keto reductase [Defluviitaleaceae bacterium]|nr:aldo/keto reductase [Defluviitaleaceae bacterium]